MIRALVVLQHVLLIDVFLADAHWVESEVNRCLVLVLVGNGDERSPNSIVV